MRTTLALRSGTSLVEAIVALVIAGVLTVFLVGAIVTQLRIAERAVSGAESNDAVWTAASLIDAEVRALRPGEDILESRADTLGLRAFRAVLAVCDTAEDVTLLRGAPVRLPDPQKDSLLLDSAGQWLATAFTTATPPSDHACATVAGQAISALRLSSAALPGTIALLFERGSYHLADGSLRWRAGAAGRQPITAPVFLSPASGFAIDSAAALLVLSTTRPGWHRQALVLGLHSRFLNRERDE